MQSLQSQDINNDNRLLINPDNVFWGLIVDKKHNGEASQKIISLHNRVKDKLDTAMRDFRFKTDLNSVYINLTDRCNARCPYCYIPVARRKNGTQMSEEQLVYVLKKIDKYFCSLRRKPRVKPIIIFHASEPLLMKDTLFALIKRFRKEFHFGIQTNAILLEKKDVAFLKSHKVSVGISLDSVDPAINERTRKSPDGSNTTKAIQAMEWFKGYEGLNVIATITKYNVKTLPQLVRFIHSQKVTCLLLNPVRATQKSIVKLRADHKDLTTYFIKAVDQAVALSRKSSRRIIIGNFSNIMLGIVAPQARRLMCDITPCGGGRCFFTITADGDMIPCGEFVGLREFSGGNIFNSSIKSAMVSKSFKKVRSRIVEKIPECDVCIYRNICGAPCPAEVYSLTGEINSKSPYCEFYKEIIPYAFKLIAEGKMKYLFRKAAVEDIKYEYNL